MLSIYLETLTWIQAEHAFRPSPSCLCLSAQFSRIWSAFTAQYGLSVGTRSPRRVAGQAGVVVCPPITFGSYPAFVHFPGSVQLQADTFRDMVEQIIASQASHGAQRFVILNTGVSTIAPLTLAGNNLVTRGIRVALANILELGKRADLVIENHVGSHANEHETSMVMAIASTVVRMENAAAEVQPWMLRQTPVRGICPLVRTSEGVGVYCRSGVIGDPTRATREKGETILRAVPSDVPAFCDGRLREPNS